MGNVTAEQLKSYIERIERLEEGKANIAADIRDVFSEAKGNGYDPKVMCEVLKLRKKNASDRDEEEHLLEVYKRALGMLPELD
jgi:uncharacterized protein (UPF0335 family)